MLPLIPLVAGGALLNWAGTRSTNKANAANASAQRAFDLKMWNLNNEYNKPVNQMSRLEEAGLNPNLIYGNGSASTGLSSNYPKASVPVVQNELANLGHGITDTIGMYYNIKQQEAQTQAIQNTADLTLQKTINESLKTQLMNLGITGKSLENQKMSALLPYATQAQEANIEKLRLGNKDMLFKVQNMNPELLKRTQFQNADLTQRINDLNPALLKLRQLQSSMMQMDLNFESPLRQIGLKGTDSWMSRMLGTAIHNLSGETPKFKSNTKPTNDELRHGRYW